VAGRLRGRWFETRGLLVIVPRARKPILQSACLRSIYTIRHIWDVSYHTTKKLGIDPIFCHAVQHILCCTTKLSLIFIALCKYPISSLKITKCVVPIFFSWNTVT
jgi:hypothetical protein